MPTLVDDGRSLWDSHAISTYLIGKYGGAGGDHPLYPRDLYTRARIDQRLQFETGVLFAVAKSIFVGIKLHGHIGPTAEHERQMADAYALLEAFLADGAFVVGDQLTVADLSLAVTVTQIGLHVPLDGVRFPRVAAWIGRVRQLPYFDGINARALEDFGQLVAGLVAQNVAARL